MSGVPQRTCIRLALIGTERIEQHEETDKLINNRQAGRRRGRGGQRSPNNSGRPEQGNRIDNRARGNAPQLLEKYRNLARDAQMQGDRVNTEYYLQFADHYFRVLNESRSRFEDQNQQRRQREDNDSDDFDGDDIRADDRFDPREQQRHQPRRDEEQRGNRAETAEQPVEADAGQGDLNGRSDDRAVDESRAPRRGRRRKAEGQPQVESAGESFDATILPPALSTPVADEGDEAGEAAPAPRRRGRPRRSEASAVEA